MIFNFFKMMLMKIRRSFDTDVISLKDVGDTFANYWKSIGISKKYCLVKEASQVEIFRSSKSARFWAAI